MVAALLALTLGLPALYFFSNWLAEFSWISLNSAFWSLFAKTLGFSLLQSVITCAVAAVLSGFIVSRVIFLEARSFKKLMKLISVLSLFLLVLPGTAISLAVLDLLSLLGLPSQGLLAVCTAHVLWNLPWLIGILSLRLRAWLKAQGLQTLDAARLLGAPSSALLKSFILPVFLQELRSLLPLIFLWSLTAFSTLVILGGSPQNSSPEVLLYLSLLNDLDPTRLGVLMLIQLLIQAFFIRRIYTLSLATPAALGHSFDFEGSSLDLGFIARKPVSSVTQKLGLFFALFFSLLLVLPIARSLVESFGFLKSSKFSADLAEQIFAATCNSALLLLAALSFCTLFLWLLLKTRQDQRKILILFSGLSSSVVAAIYLPLRLDLRLSEMPLLLGALCAFVLAVTQIPFLALWTEQGLRSIPESLKDQARILGAQPHDLQKQLLIPLMASHLRRGLLICSSLILGELALVAIFLPQLPLLSTLSRVFAQGYQFQASRLVLLVNVGLILCLLLVLGREKLYFQNPLKWKKAPKL